MTAPGVRFDQSLRLCVSRQALSRLVSSRQLRGTLKTSPRPGRRGPQQRSVRILRKRRLRRAHVLRVGPRGRVYQLNFAGMGGLSTLEKGVLIDFEWCDLDFVHDVGPLLENGQDKSRTKKGQHDAVATRGLTLVQSTPGGLSQPCSNMRLYSNCCQLWCFERHLLEMHLTMIDQAFSFWQGDAGKSGGFRLNPMSLKDKAPHKGSSKVGNTLNSELNKFWWAIRPKAGNGGFRLKGCDSGVG